MLGLVSNYSSDEHTIINGELSEWLNRLMEDDPQRRDRLFVVRYNKLGVFCICEWLGKPKDVFVDVLNLGKSLGSFGHAEALELRQRLFNPLGTRQTRDALIKADSDFYHNLQDEDAEETERQELVARGE